MNLPIKIARRYLFSKKSTNAINVITGVSVLGIAVGTAALVLVLSVFNGFEDLITSLFNYFNPDVKVTPFEGKTFQEDSSQLAQIRAVDGVLFVSASLEETAFFEFKESKDVGVVKGVDEYYDEVTGIDETLIAGKYQFEDNERSMSVLGFGLQRKLSANPKEYLEPIRVYMLKRKNIGVMEKPFLMLPNYLAGVFSIQQDFDNQYMLTSLAFARRLLNTKDELSALEIKLAPEANESKVILKIKDILGPGFVIKNRYQQDEAFLKLMNVEKWMGFAVVSLTLFLVAFNMIGALWLIVLEKKKDIAVLKSMGANNNLLRSIFLSEGLLLCVLGMLIGMAAAIIFFILQKNYGIIGLEGAFIVDSYPISMRWGDFLAVAIMVLFIGSIASWLPASKAAGVSSLFREE